MHYLVIHKSLDERYMLRVDLMLAEKSIMETQQTPKTAYVVEIKSVTHPQEDESDRH